MSARTQDGIDLVALADVLKRKGRVRGEPVAISLFHDEIPTAYDGRRVEPCAVVHHAMDLAETVYVDAQFQNCLAGAWQAGFVDPPDEIKTGRYLAEGIPGFVPIAAARVKTGVNVLPQGMLRGIGASPLAALPDGVRADVLVVVCEPVYASTIGGVRTAVDGTPPRGAAGTSLCGELFAIPWHEENVIITPGDMGGRMFNKIRPNEMFVIIPMRFAGHLPALLEGTPDVPALMESIKPGFTASRQARLAERHERAGAVSWDEDVRALLAQAPDQIRSFAEPTLVEYAREHGHARITMDVVREQMDSVGMRLEDVLPSEAPAPHVDLGASLMDRGAPVYAEAVVEVPAPPASVWKVLADIASWSEVYPELHDVVLDGPMAAGSALSFRAGPARIKARIDVADEPRLLAFTGKGMGATSTYVFRIEPADAGSRLRAEQSMSGAAVRPMKAMLQRVAETSLRDWVGAIAARAAGGAS